MSHRADNSKDIHAAIALRLTAQYSRITPKATRTQSWSVLLMCAGMLSMHLLASRLSGSVRPRSLAVPGVPVRITEVRMTSQTDPDSMCIDAEQLRPANTFCSAKTL